MPIHCVDGDITDDELSSWEIAPLRTRIALPCANIRSVFVGSSLGRGLAILALNRAQFDKLFPQRSRRKNACTLRRWASKIRGKRARAALAHVSWHQLRAAAAHDGDEAQIGAAMAHALGVRQ